MDHTVLPEIFALAVLIVACRPLFRRSDARVRFWCLGWGFVLLHFIVLCVCPLATPIPLSHGLSTIALDLCGLCFLIAASDKRLHLVNKPFLSLLAVPILLQTVVSAFRTQSVWPFAGLPHWLGPASSRATGLLLLLPGLYLLTRHGRQRRALMPVALAYVLLAILTLPASASHPDLLTEGNLALLYLSAAYLHLLHAERFTRGVLLASTGLTAWALSFPLGPALGRLVPALHVNHGMMNLPIHVAMAGILLTVLEDYLTRTERLAMHDPLTDLPNRRFFEARFAEAMQEARTQRTTVACLVIDVDNFKTINDTMGHQIGDELLRALAVRLSWHMSPRDMLARTGGDEFTAMLAGVTDEHHLRFIASAMMSAASVPVSVGGEPVDVHISMGVALSPDHADSVEELRQVADEAMYRAKRRGGDMLVFAGSLETESEVRQDPAPVLQMASVRQRRISAG